MPQRLVQIGDDLGLIIDRSVLRRLDITVETDLEIFTDGRRIVVAPARPGRPRRKLPSSPPKSRPRYGIPKKQPW